MLTVEPSPSHPTWINVSGIDMDFDVSATGSRIDIKSPNYDVDVWMNGISGTLANVQWIQKGMLSSSSKLNTQMHLPSESGHTLKDTTEFSVLGSISVLNSRSKGIGFSGNYGFIFYFDGSDDIVRRYLLTTTGTYTEILTGYSFNDGSLIVCNDNIAYVESGDDVERYLLKLNFASGTVSTMATLDVQTTQDGKDFGYAGWRCAAKTKYGTQDKIIMLSYFEAVDPVAPPISSFNKLGIAIYDLNTDTLEAQNYYCPVIDSSSVSLPEVFYSIITQYYPTAYIEQYHNKAIFNLEMELNNNLYNAWFDLPEVEYPTSQELFKYYDGFPNDITDPPTIYDVDKYGDTTQFFEGDYMMGYTFKIPSTGYYDIDLTNVRCHFGRDDLPNVVTTYDLTMHVSTFEEFSWSGVGTGSFQIYLEDVVGSHAIHINDLYIAEDTEIPIYIDVNITQNPTIPPPPYSRYAYWTEGSVYISHKIDPTIHFSLNPAIVIDIEDNSVVFAENYLQIRDDNLISVYYHGIDTVNKYLYFRAEGDSKDVLLKVNLIGPPVVQEHMEDSSTYKIIYGGTVHAYAIERILPYPYTHKLLNVPTLDVIHDFGIHVDAFGFDDANNVCWIYANDSLEGYNNSVGTAKTIHIDWGDDSPPDGVTVWNGSIFMFNGYCGFGLTKTGWSKFYFLYPSP